MQMGTLKNIILYEWKNNASFKDSYHGKGISNKNILLLKTYKISVNWTQPMTPYFDFKFSNLCSMCKHSQVTSEMNGYKLLISVSEYLNGQYIGIQKKWVVADGE